MVIIGEEEKVKEASKTIVTLAKISKISSGKVFIRNIMDNALHEVYGLSRERKIDMRRG